MILLLGIEIEKYESVGEKLRPILGNANIFGVNLYEARIGNKIKAIFCDEISGEGAVRETLRQHLV